MGRPRKPKAPPAPPASVTLLPGAAPPPPLNPVADFSWLEDFGIKESRRKEFLIAYEMYGNTNVASRHIKLNPFQCFKWRDEKNDKDELTEDAKAFRIAMQTCEENRITALENEARRRAFAGSDILLIFMLKGARPNVYRDNAKVEHEYPGGSPGTTVHAHLHNVQAPPISIQTPEHLERVMALADKYGLKDRLFPPKVIEATAAPVEAAKDVPPAV